MGSLVYQSAFLPVFLPHELVGLEAGVFELSVSLSVMVHPGQSQFIAVSGLHELSSFYIGHPLALQDVALRLVGVFTPSVFLVAVHHPLEDVSVAVDYLAEPVDLVVAELSFVLFFEPFDVDLAVALLFVLDEGPGVDVSVSVGERALPPEVAVLEVSGVGFVLEAVGAFAVLLVVLELTVVDCAA
jgi:hypothetical protein